jgi:hypothetical protein
MDASPAGMKRCSTCKEWKPLDQFNKHSAALDGRQWNCRECNKAYHYSHLDRHMAQIRQRSARQRVENKRLLRQYLLEHPCVDCGEVDPLVLEFDHLRDKAENVSRLVGAGHSWRRVVAEIAKCDVVCANCHRRRTFTRLGSWRIFGFGEDQAM